MSAADAERKDRFPTVATPPPAVTLGRAMLWNWWIVALAVLVCAGVGFAAGLARTPEYTATARLTIGRIDISSPGALSGFAVATESLATGYSRTVNSRKVAEKVAAKTGIDVKEVQDHVSATPVAKSPVFRVEATSPDADQAVRLANASSHALVRYAAELNQSDPDSKRLLDLFGKAAIKRQVASQNLQRVEDEAGQEPNAGEAEAIGRAKGELEAAEVKAKALGAAYTTSVQSQASTELIQIISPAAEASSDKRSHLLIFTFIGAVIGFVLGGALAFVRESRWTPKHSS